MIFNKYLSFFDMQNYSGFLNPPNKNENLLSQNDNYFLTRTQKTEISGFYERNIFNTF